MKFCIYEVRDDERQMLETLREKYQLELVPTSEMLDLDRIAHGQGRHGV